MQKKHPRRHCFFQLFQVQFLLPNHIVFYLIGMHIFHTFEAMTALHYNQ